LIASNIIDPRKASKVGAEAARRQAAGSDLDSDDDQSAARPGSTTGTNGRGGSKNIRTGTVGQDTDDSDFDI
jgi:hypothetical protein